MQETVVGTWYGGKQNLMYRDMEKGRESEREMIKGFSHCEEHRGADQKRESLRIYCHSQLRSRSLFAFTAALFPHCFSILNKSLREKHCIFPFVLVCYYFSPVEGFLFFFNLYLQPTVHIPCFDIPDLIRIIQN